MTAEHDLNWRTSSYSSTQENCVQVAWRTSSYSSSQENCVQVAVTADAVALRDSKNPDGGMLTVPATAFTALLASTAR